MGRETSDSLIRKQAGLTADGTLNCGSGLPSIHELSSLVDPTMADPALPTGHPFTDIQTSNQGQYWSATTDVIHPTAAWIVVFGANGGGLGATVKDAQIFVWCVRGGAVLDSY